MTQAGRLAVLWSSGKIQVHAWHQGPPPTRQCSSLSESSTQPLASWRQVMSGAGVWADPQVVVKVLGDPGTAPDPGAAGPPWSGEARDES